MSNVPTPEPDGAPEPPYAKAPRKRVLPDFLTKPKMEKEEGEVSTSQSSGEVSTSQESTEVKTITQSLLRELKDKLDNYVERENPSYAAKNSERYAHMDVTPNSSQASGSQVNYGSQESATGLADLEEDLIPYFTEKLGWEGIRQCLKGCMCIKPGPFESEDEEFEALDELHTKLNEDVFAIQQLVIACLDTFNKPKSAEEPKSTKEPKSALDLDALELKPKKRARFAEEGQLAVFYDPPAEATSPRKRTRSEGMLLNKTAPPPSP